MALRDLTPEELSAIAHENDASLTDVKAEPNTVYHEPSDRVLSIPQGLDAGETQFVIDRDVDGKKRFFGQQSMDGLPPLPALTVPPIPEPVQLPTWKDIGDSYRGLKRGGMAFLASAPAQLYGGTLVESSELATELRNNTAGKSIAEIQRDAMVDPIKGILTQVGLLFDKDGSMKTAGQQILDRNKSYLARNNLLRPKEGGIKGLMYDLGNGAGSTLASLGVAGLTKSPASAALLFGSLQKSQIYQEARTAGKSPTQSSTISTGAGAVEGILEKIGLDHFIPAMQGNSVVKRFINGAVSEGVQEGSQQTAEEGITAATDIRDEDLETALKAIAYSSFLGFTIGGGSAALLGRRAKKQAQEAGVPEAQAEAFGEYIEENLPDSTSDMGEFLRREVAPLAADNKSAAEFITLMQKFNNDVDVINRDELSEQERAVFDEYIDYFNKSTTDSAGIDSVEKLFYDKAIAAGVNQDQAVAASKLLGARADAASRALGVTPMEWYARHNLDIEVQRSEPEAIAAYQESLDAWRAPLDMEPTGLPEADITDQERNSAIEGIDAQLRQQRRVSTKADKPKKVLISWIKRNGGINIDSVTAGELRNMGFTGKKAAFLFTKGPGMTLDNIPASEFNDRFDVAAKEDGNGYVDLNWLLEQIDNETRDQPMRGKNETRIDDSFIRAIEDAGLDPRTATAEQVYEKLGPDADIIAAGKEQNENLSPKAIRQIRGIMRDNPDLDVNDAVSDWAERAAIQGDTLFQRVEKKKYKDLEELQGDLVEKENGGVETSMDEFENKIVLNKIELEKEDRKKGNGTRAMQKIVDYADQVGKRIELTASTDFGGSSVGRLKDFYKRFGFVENKGKNKDFSTRETMYREPVKTDAGQTVLPGAERISDKELAERKFQERLQPKKAQKGMDEGLFGDEMKQTTLFQRNPIIQRMNEEVLRDAAIKQMGSEIRVDEFMARVRNNTLTASDKALPASLQKLIRQVQDTLLQEGARGSVTFGRAKTLIQLFKDANASTIFHELGHVFLRDMKRVAADTRRPMVRKDWQTVKDWLGAKGNTLTEEQEEKFARGFEAYLREGKAPKPGLQGVFDRFKTWLTSIYKSAQDLNVEINEDIRRVFDRMLGGDFVRSEAQQKLDLKTPNAEQAAKDAEERRLRDYEIVAMEKPASTLYEDTSRNLRDLSNLASDAFVPVSTLLGKIDRRLKHAVRRFVFNTGFYSNEDRKAIKDFVDVVSKKFSVPDYRVLALALRNRDAKKVDELIAKYEAQEAWAKVRTTLDDIFIEAEDVGLDMGYVENYFPSKVKPEKSIDFLAFLQGTPQWGDIQEALRTADVFGNMTPGERAEVANNYLRGFTRNSINLEKPGSAKARTIEYVTPEMLAFYEDPVQALMGYVTGLRHGIESRKLFGKSEKETDKNIGAYVLKLIEEGVVSPQQEGQLKNILKAVVDPVGTRGFVGWSKNASYIYLMGSPISAITQIQDLAFSLAFNGYYRTGKSLLKSLPAHIPLAGRKIGDAMGLIRKEDIGIDNILEEYSSNSRASKAVRATFKAVGLTGMDDIGKEVYINAALDRVRAANKRGGAAWDSLVDDIFGVEGDQFKKDLEDGVMSENVKYMLFSELSDIQPISLAEMPRGYLRGGNGRIFYMLKTYTIKQIDIYRRTIISEIASGDPKRMIVGVRNFIHLGAALMLMGMASDALKDLLLGRDIDIDSLVTDNIIKSLGITKYQIYKSKRDGIAVTFFQTLFVPPVLAPVDDLQRDIRDIGIKEKKPLKDAELLGRIPLVGKFYYWWWGGGSAKEEKNAK